MRKRLSILFLAAALGLGLSYGGVVNAQPKTPPPGAEFPGGHMEKPDFKRPDRPHPGQDMKNRIEHGKKDFQDRMEHGKKDFQDRMEHGKKDFRDKAGKRNKDFGKFDKRGDGKNFRPGDHKGGPDFDKSGHNFRPGDHKGGPDFGKPGQHPASNFRPGQPK